MRPSAEGRRLCIAPLQINDLEGGLLDGAAAGRSNTRPSFEGKKSNGGQVAQLVEQRTENPRVVGSIPTLATTSHVGKRYRCVRTERLPIPSELARP